MYLYMIKVNGYLHFIIDLPINYLVCRGKLFFFYQTQINTDKAPLKCIYCTKQQTFHSK